MRILLACVAFALFSISSRGQQIPAGTWVGDFVIRESTGNSGGPSSGYRHGAGILQIDGSGKGQMILVAYEARSGVQKSTVTTVASAPGKRPGLYTVIPVEKTNSNMGDASLRTAFFSVAEWMIASDTVLQQVSTASLDPRTGRKRYAEGIWTKTSIDAAAFDTRLAYCNKLVQKKSGGVALKAAIRGGDTEGYITDQIMTKFRDCLSGDYAKITPAVRNAVRPNALTILAPGLAPVLLELEQDPATGQAVQGKNYRVQWKNPTVDGIEPAKLFALTSAQFTVTNTETGKKTTIMYPQVTPASYTNILEESKDAIVINVGQISDFREGYAIYRKGEQFGMIGGSKGLQPGKFDFKFGPWQSAFPNEPLCGFYNGLSVAFNPQTGKAGFIDTAGKVVIPFEWKEVSPFQPDGYAWSKVYDEKTRQEYRFFFDRRGRRYATGNANPNINEPLVRKELPDLSATEFYRKNGKLAFKTDYRIWDYADGLYTVSSKSGNSNKYGLMDTTGKLVVPFTMNEKPEPFSEGFALYRPKYKDEYEAVFIDKTGAHRIYLKKTENILAFEKIGPFTYGYSDITVTTPDQRGLRVLLDSAGNYHNIELLFKQANPQIFKDLTNLMQKPVKFRYTGRRNEWGLYVEVELLLKPGSKTAEAFSNASRSTTGGVGGGDSYIVSKGIGMIDYQGNILIPPVFEYIGNFDPVIQVAKAIYNPGAGQPSIQGFIDQRGVFELRLDTSIEGFRN